MMRRTQQFHSEGSERTSLRGGSASIGQNDSTLSGSRSKSDRQLIFWIDCAASNDCGVEVEFCIEVNGADLCCRTRW